MTPLANQDDLTLGSMSLRPSTCELVHPGGIETIEPQVMRVLLALARHPGRVLSRDAIVDQAWDGRAVSDDAINRVLSRLRRLAGLTGAFRLSTIRKVGYRLDVVVIGEASAGNGAPGPDLPPLVARRRLTWIFGLLALVAVLSAVALVFSRLAPSPAPAGPSLSLALTIPDPADAAAASSFDRQIRETLSHMQGLRLIAAPGDASRTTDLVLEGVFGHGGQKPVIDLTLLGPVA